MRKLNDWKSSFAHNKHSMSDVASTMAENVNQSWSSAVSQKIKDYLNTYEHSSTNNRKHSQPTNLSSIHVPPLQTARTVFSSFELNQKQSSQYTNKIKSNIEQLKSRLKASIDLRSMSDLHKPEVLGLASSQYRIGKDFIK